MFEYSRNTVIITSGNTGLAMSKPILNAIEMLERDKNKRFIHSSLPANEVMIMQEKMERPEQFKLQISAERIQVCAEDDLGIIYGLLYISEQYLGIRPFWFYMDQQIYQDASVEIPEGSYESEEYPIRFRGWFLNDEVLMMKWKFNENGVDGWRMAFEALLRCGGNMVIPGTDKLARKNHQLASDMGLWITHHHAEPLGAEMFARVYPNVTPDILEHEELFYQLWEKAIKEQKNSKVVWNLCFRGQGDMPFWANDTSGRFDTPKARGEVIGKVIKKQYDLVKKHVENPVFCTNLYGEIMELYAQGFLELPDDIIKIRADNGYGKMVTRRQNNHNPRCVSMPDLSDNSPQGIYYHISFYDLQAANHITMFPNSVDFMDQELSQVSENGGRDFWVINCSNIRPHVYFLDAVRKKWRGENVSDQSQSHDFAVDYFDGNQEIAECYKQYPQAMLCYGKQEDEHIGEQYYMENTRVLIHQFLTDKNKGADSLIWLTGEMSLAEQVERFCNPCRQGIDQLQILLDACKKVSESLSTGKRNLFDATIYLHAKIHAYCAKGTILFGDGYKAYQEGDYESAFLQFGDSACCFDAADMALNQAEYGVWKDFYKNDCLTDIRHTVYMIKKIMGIMRELGDGTYHEKWYHRYCCSKEDRGICLLMFTERHMTDWEIYLAMKACEELS